MTKAVKSCYKMRKTSWLQPGWFFITCKKDNLPRILSFFGIRKEFSVKFDDDSVRRF